MGFSKLGYAIKQCFLSVYIKKKFAVPLVSRILPSDVCKIYKRGSNIRLDTTLVDFSDMRWERGDISFIFRGDVDPTESLTVMDNVGQLYQRVRYEVSKLGKTIFNFLTLNLCKGK